MERKSTGKSKKFCFRLSSPLHHNCPIQTHMNEKKPLGLGAVTHPLTLKLYLLIFSQYWKIIIKAMPTVIKFGMFFAATRTGNKIKECNGRERQRETERERERW